MGDRANSLFVADYASVDENQSICDSRAVTDTSASPPDSALLGMNLAPHAGV